MAKGKTRALRPLLLAPYGGFGGSENVLLRLVALMGDRIDARSVVMSEGPLAGRLRELGVPTHVEHLPGKRGGLHFRAVAKELTQRYAGEGIDLIHANGTKATGLGVLLARGLGVPLLWMKHDHGYSGPVAQNLALQCEAVICVSQAMADLLGPRARARTVVAYPGVEPEKGPPARDTPPVIGAVGRIDPAKGFDELIRALAILRDRGHEDARLRIAGPVYPVFPGHGDELRVLATELGVGDRVQMGWVDDLREHYRTSRVSALTSLKIPRRPAEGAPLVLIEAMNQGRPAVGIAEGGVAEVIGDCGTLVTDRTPAGFADAIEPYLADSTMADAVGARGQQRVRDHFTEAQMVAVVEKAYHDVVARGRRPHRVLR